MAQSVRRAFALSPSRANDYQQCPLLFRFRVLDRLPEPPSAAAARGTLVHSVLERLYDLPAGERTPGAAAEFLPTAWQEMIVSRPELEQLPEVADAAAEQLWLASARTLVERYFTLEDPNFLAPRARELLIEAQLPGGPLLRGVVDRVDVAPDGAVRIVDYKTGRAPRPQYSDAATFQMRFYGVLIWRTRKVVPTMLQLLYLGDGQVLRAEGSLADLERAEQRIEALWSAISHDAMAGHFAPRPTKLCNWCAHQAICPAFGGTAPGFDADLGRSRLGLSTNS